MNTINALTLQQVLRTREAARLCGVSLSHFRRLHWAGQLPPPIKLGERRLGWRVADILSWLSARQGGARNLEYSSAEPTRGRRGPAHG
ncbi:helix-turn-helix transcriptional regulator [Rhodoplanes roseus]|uniref:AlpA family phage regulatory protein n=1 Tax=Rhodoplanes roseus TaxID=29409 RepID=A0A327L2K8_9BRAD|nr:hypothetical protein CH341_04450 [Rhodoplanes roseus]